MERNVKSLERIVHLQGEHLRNQVAVLEKARLLTDSQRQLIVAHSGLLAQQWVIIEKAACIIIYLAVALVSISILLTLRLDFTRFIPLNIILDLLSRILLDIFLFINFIKLFNIFSNIVIFISSIIIYNDWRLTT